MCLFLLSSHDTVSSVVIPRVCMDVRTRTLTIYFADRSSFREAETQAELEVQEKLSLLEWFANEYKRFGCTLEFVTNKSQVCYDASVTLCISIHMNFQGSSGKDVVVLSSHL